MASARYIMGRSIQSSIRLNHQHLIFKLQTGYLLHHSIPIVERTDPIRIADIGTGTAIWPIEISSSFPNLKSKIEIDGFDISDQQFPPRQWLPPNVRLHVQDAWKEYPQEFQGVYDIVNVRAFVLLLNPQNIKSWVSRTLSLLKPGGYLHWVEFDPCSQCPVPVDPSDDIPEIRKNVKFWRDIAQDAGDAMKESSIRSVIEDEGATIETYERYPTEPHIRALWSYNSMMGTQEILTSGNKYMSAESFERLCNEYSRASVDVELFCTVARKKSNQDI